MTRTLRSIGRQHLQAAVLGAAGALSLLIGRPAQAQWGNQQNGQMLFEWQGYVDRETDLTVGARGVDVRGTQSNESRGRFVSRGALPRGSGTLYVQRVTGRGRVDVISQPGYNSGDGVVRIQDPSGGQGYYDIRVYWQPNNVYGNNGGYGNGGNGGNGGYDRSRDGVYERNGEVGRGRNSDVALDRRGNVIRDRRGNVVYERRGNQTLVRDRNGNAVFDRNGNPVYEKSNNGRWGRD